MIPNIIDVEAFSPPEVPPAGRNILFARRFMPAVELATEYGRTVDDGNGDGSGEGCRQHD